MRRLLLLVVVSTVGVADCEAAILSYDVLQRATADPGVTALNVNHGAGVNRLSTNYATNQYRETDLAGAIADDDYVSFGFQSVDMYDLTALEFRARSRNNGPEHLVVMASIANGPFQQIGSQQFMADFYRTHTIDVTSLTGVDDVEFRFYLWGETSSSFGPIFHLSGGGAGGLDPMITLDGIIAVPEPTALPAILIIAIGVMRHRRRSDQTLR